MLLQLLVMVIEVSEFVRQDVGVWHEVVGGLTVSFLHSHAVEAKTVLAGNFITLGEMVDLLVLI